MIAALRLCALCLLLATGMAQAQFLNTLGASPVSRFNATDNQLMWAAVNKVLADPADGVALAWKNDASPASGVVTAQRTYASDGRKCRDLLVANSFQTLRGEAVHTFCEDGSGQWKLRQ
jgi:surface antigen